MTLIIGILCENGVVLAADSQATMGNAGAGHTAAQRTAHKLSIHHDKMIVGFAGFVGLSQRLKPLIEGACKDQLQLRGAKPETMASNIREKIVPVCKAELEMSQAVYNLTHNQGVVGYALPNALIAMPLQDQPCLLQILETCAVEYASADLPFVAIGSGQRDAEPFLAFIRDTLWPAKKLPSVADAQFSAFWTLKHVIEINPSGGIGGSIQIVSLLKNGGWKAVEMTPGERLVHENAVEGAGRALQAWRADFGQTPTGPAPTAPPV